MKNKTRRSLFTEIGSPPEPIVTRWSTWIASAEYYAENIVQVKEIVNSFSVNGVLVQKAKEAANNENNETALASLVKIKRDYSHNYAHNYHQEIGKLKVRHSRGTQ